MTLAPLDPTPRPPLPPPPEDGSALPEHLIALPDVGPGAGGWALWRNICVRGAGFPAAQVLRVADEECAAAADRLGEAEAEAERLREAALEAVRAELPGAGKERLDPLIKAIQRLKKRKMPKAEGLAAATVAAAEAWKVAEDRAAAERAAYRRAFDAAWERLFGVLREAARDERFREAVVWQNRHAAGTGLASLLRREQGGRKGNARDRGHEQMLASYLQRYCTKNDTIGFFGPVGWGRFSESPEPVRARAGERMLAARRVYFEGWAIDALADLLAQDPAMRPWLAPRRSPLLRREGRLYVGASGQKIQLGPLSSALFDACDGTRPARELVRQVGEAPGLPKASEAVLYRMLADLHAKGLVRWAFQVPLSLSPEDDLRAQIRQIGDAALRERALGLLEEIVGARDAVARAAGAPEELDRALGELEEKFTRATGRASTRSHGQTYAGRTLIQEDCRRDLDLELGAPVLAELARPLSLVLASARWFTHHVARHHRQFLEQVYEEMAREAGTPVLDLQSFSRVALPGLVHPRLHPELQGELHARWERVLLLPPGERRVHFTSEELRPRVIREFAAEGPGWERARYHSPDVLIAAESVEAIRRGDYQIVMGEIHLAVNTIDRGVFMFQHPDPPRLRADMDLDLRTPSVVPMLPKMWLQEEAWTSLGFRPPGVTARVDVGMRSAKDYYLDLCLDPPNAPLERVLAIGEMVVERGEGGLVVRPRGREVAFEIVDFFQLAMMSQAIKTFAVLPSRRHTPRITIDRLVLTRESWSFPARVLAFAHLKDEADRFAAARRWAREQGMPRFVFVKTPSETKPFYLDWASPAFVENFTKAVRQTLVKFSDASIGFSEMLPGPDRTWLPDAQGNRYTSELRIVAVDRT